MITELSKILESVPFGMAIEVDKGLIIENLCASLGIRCYRPPKKLRGQTQQLAVDTAETQKVGNTRIVIEQVNGQSKISSRYFNGVIPILQLGLAPLLFRVAILMQNFKLGFIQGAVSPATNEFYRPSRAEIRWYDGDDDGLVDVRGMFDYWATEAEMQRIRELKDEFHRKGQHVSNTDIAEQVLAENWPAKLRQELKEKQDLL